MTTSRMSKISEEKENAAGSPTYPGECSLHTARTYQSRFRLLRIESEKDDGDNVCLSVTEKSRPQVDESFTRAVHPFQKSPNY